MKKILAVSLVAMMAVSTARADIASTAYVQGAVSAETALREAAVEAINKELDTMATTVVVDGKQPKSTADYQMGNGDGDWTTMTAAQQNALNSGVTTATVSQVATNTGNISAINETLDDLGGLASKNEVTSSEIKDGAIVTVDIADSAVTTAKLAASAVTSAKIADGTVALDDLASGVRASLGKADSALQSDAIANMQTTTNIHTSTTTALTGEALNTKYPSVGYVDTKVASVNTDLGAVTNTANQNKADIAGINETLDDLGGLASKNEVTSSEITDGTIVTVDIADSAVTTAKLAASAVTSAKIADGTVALDDLASNSVNSAKIVDASIATADIANGAVTAAKIGADVTVNGNTLTKPTTDGNYVLTLKVVNGALTMGWEAIARDY